MKIYSPNKNYTGISASVPFCGGVGETNDPYLIKWFKDHGYKVEESKEDKLDADSQPDLIEDSDTKSKRRGTKEKEGGE